MAEFERSRVIEFENFEVRTSLCCGEENPEFTDARFEVMGVKTARNFSLGNAAESDFMFWY